MIEATLSSKNQIVIPRGAREPLRLKPKDKLLIVVRGDMMIVMRKPDTHAQALRGAGKSAYPAGYLAEERDSWK
jgi:AbrB family looped-hinge helix DNA binding protein